MEKTLTGMCESCLMPFKKDPLALDREHEKYCSYCFRNGKFTYEGDDVAGFKRSMITAMIARGDSSIKARVFAFMAGFAPRWKK